MKSGVKRCVQAFDRVRTSSMCKDFQQLPLVLAVGFGPRLVVGGGAGVLMGGRARISPSSSRTQSDGGEIRALPPIRRKRQMHPDALKTAFRHPPSLTSETQTMSITTHVPFGRWPFAGVELKTLRVTQTPVSHTLLSHSLLLRIYDISLYCSTWNTSHSYSLATLVIIVIIYLLFSLVRLVWLVLYYNHAKQNTPVQNGNTQDGSPERIHP